MSKKTKKFAKNVRVIRKESFKFFSDISFKVVLPYLFFVYLVMPEQQKSGLEDVKNSTIEIVE